MKTTGRVDPLLIRRIEDAEGIEVFEEQPTVAAVLRQHEEAQGTEVFGNPDAVVPADAVRGGAPGQQELSGDSAEAWPDETAEYGPGEDVDRG